MTSLALAQAINQSVKIDSIQRVPWQQILFFSQCSSVTNLFKMAMGLFHDMLGALSIVECFIFRCCLFRLLWWRLECHYRVCCLLPPGQQLWGLHLHHGKSLPVRTDFFCFKSSENKTVLAFEDLKVFLKGSLQTKNSAMISSHPKASFANK